MARTYGKDDTSIDAKEGEEFSIALESVAGGGYQWDAEFDREKVELVKKKFDAPGGSVGGSGKDVFTFKPTGKGEAMIRLTYKRPWEQKAEATHEVKVALGK